MGRRLTVAIDHRANYAMDKAEDLALYSIAINNNADLSQRYDAARALQRKHKTKGAHYEHRTVEYITLY